jgi:hypothetical protein
MGLAWVRTRDMDVKKLVETGYDPAAEPYLATKDPCDTVIRALLERLAWPLPAAATVWCDRGRRTYGAAPGGQRRMAFRWAVTRSSIIRG